MPRKKKSKEQTRQIVWIPTGCTVLDCCVGGGVGFGYPAGMIINVVGDSSSGKTFLNCELIASAYHMYGDKLKWVYDDAESGFTFDTECLYGFEIMPEKVSERFHSGTVEELYGNVRTFIDDLDDDSFGIYVVDTLDGLSSDELDELAEKRYKAFKENKSADTGSYRMQSAKFLSQEFFRTLTDIIKDKRILLIFTSQIRHNADPISRKKWSRSGGKALDFYAYGCVWLRKLTTITKRGRAIGTVVKAEVDKLKAPRPYRECVFTVLFEYGVDDIGSNIDFLYDLRSEKDGRLKKGAVSKIHKWDEEDPDEEPKTRSTLIQYVEENELEEELRERVMDKWEEIEKAVKINRKSKYAKKEKMDGGDKEEAAADRKGDRPAARRKPSKSTSSKTRTSKKAEKEDQD